MCGAASLWTGIPSNPLQSVPSTELAKVTQIVVAAREKLGELVAGQAGTATRPREGLFVGSRHGSRTTTAVSVGQQT